MCWMAESTHTIHGYGIFTYIYQKNPLNVGKYTIHGCYGVLYIILSMFADAAHCKHISNTSWAFQCFMNLSCSNHSQQSPYSTRAHPLCNLLYLFFLCNWVVVESTTGWFIIDTYIIYIVAVPTIWIIKNISKPFLEIPKLKGIAPKNM